MSNFIKRFLLTVIGLPIIFLIIFLPVKTHIFIIILIFLYVVILGSYEFTNIIIKKSIKVSYFFLPIVNSLIFIFAYFYANNIFNINQNKLSFLLFFLFLIIVISVTYAKDILKKDLSKSLEKTSFILLGVIYISLPSFFIPFIFNIQINPVNPVNIFLNVESNGTMTGSLLALFLIVNVFANDIFAYVFGMLFGKNNSVKLESSPNKSWAGYIGGFFSTFVFVTIFYLLFDKNINIFNNPLKILNNDLLFYFIVPLFCGILVPLGDLVESVFKRSANLKDSGTIVLGRGGVLDSIDSLFFSLPIYFIYIQIYFTIKSW